MWFTRLAKLRNDADGAVATILAVGLMVVLVAFISLAVDVGHLYTVRSELQNTCDAAALTAVRALVVPTTVSSGGQTAPGTYLDASAAKDAAMSAINGAAAQQGLPTLAYGDGSVNITFGHWEDKTSTWTAIGDYSSVPTNPDPYSALAPNAVEVKVQRSGTGSYGPVTNFFGSIFGLVDTGLASESSDTLGVPTANVAAVSRAYLGYALEVPLGAVPIPLTLPPDVINPSAADNENASNGKLGWFASLFSPDKAVASTIKRFYFKDTGGNNVNTTVNNSPTVDANQTNQAYWFTCNPNDSVPTSLTNIMNEAAKSTHTNHNSSTSLTASGRTVYFVDPLSLGSTLYPKSEFKYYGSGYYLQNLFYYLQTAWNTKKDANGHWQVLLPIFGYTANPLTSSKRLGKAFGFLAWLLGPRPAYACFTFPPPYVYVNSFATVDITSVVYSPMNSSGCDQCSNWSSSTNPNTGKKYTSLKQCLQVRSTSCWNANYAIIENVRDVSTIVPGSFSAYTNPGTSSKVYATTGQGGGISNHVVTSSAPVGVGGLGNVPRLIPIN